MNKYKYLVIAFLFLLFSSIGFAANTISYSSITLESGTINDLPVSILLDEDYSTLLVTLEYNNRIIDVKKISSEFTSDLLFEFDNRNDTGIINITLYKNLGNKVDLNIQIEALAYYLKETSFRISQMKFDNAYKEFEQNNSIIKIISDDIQQGTPFNLMQNFPNPFNDYTTFYFSLNSDASVQFKVIDNSGQEVLDNSQISESIKIYKMHIGGGETAISDGNFYLLKGKYRLDFNPLDNYFASGVYYFTIKINDVFLSKPFIYNR